MNREPLNLSTMKPDVTQRCIDGAAGGLLTSAQRQRLAMLAGRAYDAQIRLGLYTGTPDGFRHAAVFEHFGKSGVRALTQADYRYAVRMFLEMAGNAEFERRTSEVGNPLCAPRSDFRVPSSDQSRARDALRMECGRQAEAFGGEDGAHAYAVALLRRIHKTDLVGANARQLWQVFFTIRNRSRSKTRQDAPRIARRKGGHVARPGAKKRRQGQSPGFPRPANAAPAGWAVFGGDLNAEVRSRMSEVRDRTSDVGSRTSDVGCRTSDEP